MFRLPSKENAIIRCRICGGLLRPRVTNLPYKLAGTTIAILKALPVFECPQCGDTELDQATMLRVDQLLGGVNQPAELEVILYAA